MQPLMYQRVIGPASLSYWARWARVTGRIEEYLNIWLNLYLGIHKQLLMQTISKSIFDFIFEREMDESSRDGGIEAAARVTSHEQPTPKKMRVDQSHNSSSLNNTMNLSKTDMAGSSQKIWTGNLGNRLLQSATKSITPILSNQEDGEILPAATYDPSGDGEVNSGDSSGDSEDFANKVSKVMDGDADSSKNNAGVWLASCEIDLATRTNEILLHKDVTKQISFLDNTEREAQVPLLTQSPEGITSKDITVDFQNLVNPCKKLKDMREERRSSNRLQEAMTGDTLLHSVAGGKKRAAEGTQIPPPPLALYLF